MTTSIAHPITEVATRWQIDPAHSNIEFGVRHLMISTVKGRFGEVAGTVTVDPDDPKAVGVDVTLKTASIDTRQDQRDAHLRSPDFFDASNFPVMTFRSTKVEQLRHGYLRVLGDLTIRGTTREVVLDVEETGRGGDPWGNQRIGYNARTSIKRDDFGLIWNQALETGGVVVSSDVRITLDAELVKT